MEECGGGVVLILDSCERQRLWPAKGVDSIHSRLLFILVEPRTYVVGSMCD